MSAAEGARALGPGAGRILVKTFRTGMAAKLGHDLTIEATRWHGELVVDTAAAEARTVSVSVPIDGLLVREGVGGAKPLTDSDRKEINKKIREILLAEQWPTIDFRSTSVTVGESDSFTVEGNLTIVGTTRTVAIHGHLAGEHAHGLALVPQTRWGIPPYSAFYGALKLKDEVQVEFDLAVGSSGR